MITSFLAGRDHLTWMFFEKGRQFVSLYISTVAFFYEVTRYKHGVSETNRFPSARLRKLQQ